MDDTSKIMGEYSQVIFDDTNSTLDKGSQTHVAETISNENDQNEELGESRVDMIDMMVTYNKMFDEKCVVENTLRQVTKKVETLESEIEEKERKLSVILEDNLYLRDENEKIKNEIRQIKSNSDDQVFESEEDLKDECVRMEAIILQLEQNLDEMTENNANKKENIKLLEENLAYYLAENTKLIHGTSTEGISQGFARNNTTVAAEIIHDDTQSVFKDFIDFKKFVTQ